MFLVKDSSQRGSKLTMFSFARIKPDVQQSIAGGILVLITLASATVLTGFLSIPFLKQPLWWVLVPLCAALQMLFVRSTNRRAIWGPGAERHTPSLPPRYNEFFESAGHLGARSQLKAPEVVDQQHPEFTLKNGGVPFTLIGPQVAEALELPFQHMGVRTEKYRQEIEKAVDVLYSQSDFDKQVFSSCVHQLLQAARQNWTDLAAFSPREREILELLLQTISYKEMSRRLCVSSSTIKTHIYHIFQKLGVSTRDEAVCLIRERGWFYHNEHGTS